MKTLKYWMGTGVLVTWALTGIAIGQSNVLNYFDRATASGDNALRLTGTWYVGATQVTATGAQLNWLTTAGAVTLDGGNPTSIDLSAVLGTIYGCSATIQGSTAPGSDPTAVSVVTDAVAGRLDIYAWKPTGAGDTALVASTNSARVVQYVCTGID